MIKKASLLAVLVLTPLAARAQEDVSALLQRQTQEMVDAIAAGGAQVWDRYVDEKAVYTAEDGSVLTKAELVEGIKPLPPGVSGTIKVTDFKVTQHGDVAIASYLNDEHETYHGHELHCHQRAISRAHRPQGFRLRGKDLLQRTIGEDLFRASERMIHGCHLQWFDNLC